MLLYIDSFFDIICLCSSSVFKYDEMIVKCQRTKNIIFEIMNGNIIAIKDIGNIDLINIQI